MALFLGKAGLVIGGGLVASLYLKDGESSSSTGLISGALKGLFNQFAKGPATAAKSGNNDTHLLNQVDILRQEIFSLSKHRQMIVVTGSSSGSSKYGIIIIVVVGCGGYAWWKGWKFPSMMFATKRGLSEACDSVAKQLEELYSTLRLSRRELSSKIDSVSTEVKEVTEFTTDTNRKVNEISQDISGTSKDIQFVQETVYSLRSKIERIEVKQDATNMGVMQLVGVANDIKHSRATSQAQALPPACPSGQALQRRQLAASSLQPTRSLPALEPSTSHTCDEINVQVPVTPSSTRRQDLSIYTKASLGARANIKPTNESRIQEDPAIEPSSSSTIGKLISGFSGLMRTRSAVVPATSVIVKQGGLDGALK